MTAKSIENLPLVLAALAFMLVFIAFVSIDILAGMVLMTALTVIVGPIAALMTFVMARLCLRSIQKHPNAPPARAVFIGAVFGLYPILMIAFLFSLALGAMWNYFGALKFIFIYGGFLGPLIGGITAYIVAKSLKAHQKTSDTPA